MRLLRSRQRPDLNVEWIGGFTDQSGQHFCVREDSKPGFSTIVEMTGWFREDGANCSRSTGSRRVRVNLSQMPNASNRGRRIAGQRRNGAAGPRTRPWAALRHEPPWLPRAVFTSTLIVIGLLFLVHLLARLRGLFILVLISFFLSCALEAPVNRLVRRGWRRSGATAAVFVAALVIVAAFVWLMGQVVVRQVTSLIDQLPEYSRDAANLVDERFHTHLSYEDVTAQLTGRNSLIARFGGQFAGNVVGVSTSVLGLLFQTLSVALFTYYLTVDGPRLRHWLCTFMPADRQREFMRFSDIAIDRTSAYLNYRLVLAMLSTIVHSLFFQSIGLPSAVALGLWVGVISQFIPTIGTYIAAFLPILVALTQDLRTAVFVVVFIVAYQQIENYVISPRLGRRALKVHPAVGFGAVLAGTAILGAVGAVLALPMVAIMQSFAGAYVHRHEVIPEMQQELETATPNSGKS
jgi:predicted PurR-regulated permease PerM